MPGQVRSPVAHTFCHLVLDLIVVQVRGQHDDGEGQHVCRVRIGEIPVLGVVQAVALSKLCNGIAAP